MHFYLVFCKELYLSLVSVSRLLFILFQTTVQYKFYNTRWTACYSILVLFCFNSGNGLKTVSTLTIIMVFYLVWGHIFLTFVYAGIASVHFLEPGWAWHAWDHPSCITRYNFRENIWWSWTKNSLFRVSTDYPTGLLFFFVLKHVFHFHKACYWMLFFLG